MANIRLPAAALLLGLLVAGCDNVTNAEDQEDDVISAEGQEELVTAEVHLQEGFEGHWVSVELGDDVHFQARLDSLVPFAGPQAVFRLDVPRGTHQLLIRWVPTDGDRQARISILDIQLDQAEFYYLGLTVSGNSIQVAVQESPFLYV